VLVFDQICNGFVNVPERQTTVVPAIVFSLAAIQALTVADVAPPDDENVTAHAAGAAMGEPVGVTGLGIKPSLSAGACRCGSIGKSPTVTGGVG
jgi:hypothetical protein